MGAGYSDTSVSSTNVSLKHTSWVAVTVMLQLVLLHFAIHISHTVCF